MAYEGYRLKINNQKIDNTMIKQGSYSVKPTRRVLDKYYDAAGGYHEELSPVVKMEISFTIREHNMDEHASLMSVLSERTVSLVYWNDLSGEYASGTFRVEDFKIPHNNALSNKIEYGSMMVKMKEN